MYTTWSGVEQSIEEYPLRLTQKIKLLLAVLNDPDNLKLDLLLELKTSKNSCVKQEDS